MLVRHLKCACRRGPCSASHTWKCRLRRGKTVLCTGVLRGPSQHASISQDPASQCGGEGGRRGREARERPPLGLLPISHLLRKPPSNQSQPPGWPFCPGLKGNPVTFSSFFLGIWFPSLSVVRPGADNGGRLEEKSPQLLLGHLECLGLGSGLG